MSLGARIRLTRTQKGITLQELSDRSGLSKGFICQLENDKASPSLQALEKLSVGLSVPIAYLFLTATDKVHVVRDSERQEYRVGPEGLLVQLLSASRRNLKMMMIHIPPGMGTGGDNHVHEGEECHLVLQGTVRYTQGDESVILKAGDSLHWNGFVPHRVENLGPGEARVLCVTSGAMEQMLECSECGDAEEDLEASGLLVDER
ncbi:MAG TPA: XRE family transcriptional regulator [Symbiobacteriaceae bacterium]|nr:XRE family transcriptional regulator [Symbiobacteriaceae bacterium]